MRDNDMQRLTVSSNTADKFDNAWSHPISGYVTVFSLESITISEVIALQSF